MYSTANPSVLLVVSEPAMNRSRHTDTNCMSAYQHIYTTYTFFFSSLFFTVTNSFAREVN
jgi:hypothetical protein